MGMRIITGQLQVVKSELGLAIPVDSLVGFLDAMPPSDLKNVLLTVLLTAEQKIPIEDGTPE